MMSVRKFLRIPSAGRWLLVRAALWLTAIRIGLWFVPFQSLLNYFETRSRQAATSTDPGAAERIAWAVNVASRFVPGAHTCLPRALATMALMRRSGIPAQLRLGLARGEGGQTEAHAWVESGGRVIIGADELERYVPIPALKGVDR